MPCLSLYLVIIFGVSTFCLTSCQTTSSRHEFVQPATDWRTKSGQLQYRGPKTALIGEVLVRFSKQGDFELTFTKGPGVVLIMIRQDNNFARVEGPLARGRWAGPIKQAPEQLRSWLALRSGLVQNAKHSFKQTAGSESFDFEF